MQSNAAGVIAPVFQTFEAFEQNGSDIALRYRADDAAHGKPLLVSEEAIVEQRQ
jgi:hypothetical protein